jgi:hypothetical protein
LRHIDIDLLEADIPVDWKKRAEQALQEVKKAAPGKARSDKIDEYSHLWKELKDLLKQLSHKKCWYCESAGHRIIGDVDHYRPKNKLKRYIRHTHPDHAGYWWLAFDWGNYRFACELCNRLNKDHVTGIVGGKGSYFPLIDEGKRVYDECKPFEILQEEPLLLDPTVATDPLLLTFEEDGSAQPASNDKNEYLRADASIRLYHLNHHDLKERRRHEIFRVIHEKVTIADMFRWQYDQDKSNVSAREGYRNMVRDLKRMINEQAEYSAAARAALKRQRRPDRLWINDLLMAS